MFIPNVSRYIGIGNCSINKNDDDEPLLNNLNVKHALTLNYTYYIDDMLNEMDAYRGLFVYNIIYRWVAVVELRFQSNNLFKFDD